ncbi:Undecaprenyl-diphosphatase [Desulfatibacillum alkenivorans DSM 16219]|uniref:Undecaprenyl-diphosphatase n=1 Tax=Desulfatibacillum alkenivorans DSM 16219 TaxID=1121393 RepID=A0A1M6E6H9_9BACT|nr:undecaprenyl-diphosphate phosphatase [Desulfatibacillum alkenivorans]SHI81051.1 Undecaprenyl-diphosphatase [Desulfatibacillum alkenivorans DSM 16219]
MHWLEVVLLGVIQGLTEFLPVSSSGHLVLFQGLMGMEEPELLLDICLHVGTLAAVLWVFYPQILEAAKGLFRFCAAVLKGRAAMAQVWADDQDARMALLIIIGTIPTGFIGMGFHKIADKLFASPVLAGAMLLITGALLWATRYVRAEGKLLPKVTWGNALTVGTVQGLAILPGISRSGSTICAALFLGVDREVAARYSFLLSIPAIAAALILEVADAGAAAHPPVSMLLLGGIVSALTGLAALKWLLAIVRKGSLWWFAPYCWLVGATVLVANFI